MKNPGEKRMQEGRSSFELVSGTPVDRYIIEETIGEGGMATVYLAKHTILGSRHALKVMHEEHGALQNSILHEGRVQASLDPMYVVQVTDVVSVHEKPALVMPFVDGCSLAELLVEWKPSPRK